MLKTVTKSGNKKTGPIAVTYRAGPHHAFATCPSSCALNPHGQHGSTLIDAEYLAAVRQAVPPEGIAWTYSHFPAALLPVPAEGETVINASTDSPDQALAAVRAGRPAVLAAPAESPDQWPQRIDGVRFVRCPAETSEPVNCANCGGRGRPLCARADRNYVIVFTGHGSRARLVGQDTAGGCYGELGPVRLQWEAARSKGAADDAAAVRDFARSLPAGSMLRHHVVGDIGRPA